MGQSTAGRLGKASASLWLLLAAAIPAAPAQLRARPLAYPGVDADGTVLTLAAALHTMAAQAGVIFVGTVTSVRRLDPNSLSAPVEITFIVQQPVRGVTGPTYTLREWGGLLPPGQRAFTVGDRRLMLLHTPAATGLSSPVGGFEGVIPVTGAGTRIRPTSTLTADAVDMLDLRWIAARLAHPILYADAAPTEASHRPQTRSAAPEAFLTHPPIPIHGTERSAGPIALEPTITDEMPVATVLQLLVLWTAGESRAR